MTSSGRIPARRLVVSATAPRESKGKVHAGVIARLLEEARTINRQRRPVRRAFEVECRRAGVRLERAWTGDVGVFEPTPQKPVKRGENWGRNRARERREAKALARGATP